MFKEETRCPECSKIIKKDTWIKYKGKYFDSWECQQKYETEHDKDRVKKEDVIKSWAPCRQPKGRKKYRNQNKKRKSHKRRIKR